MIIIFVLVTRRQISAASIGSYLGHDGEGRQTPTGQTFEINMQEFNPLYLLNS